MDADSYTIPDLSGNGRHLRGYPVAPPADADSDFELDSPNWLYDALPNGERVNDPRRNRDADRHADFHRAPHSWRGWLHALRVSWRSGRGGRGAQGR